MVVANHMRRWATAIVVGGILLLAVLAAADAFRGSSKERAAQPTTSTVHPRGRTTPANTLRRDRITGQLIYSDPLCALKVTLLPSLKTEPVVSERSGGQLNYCSFSIAAGHTLAGKVAATRDGETIARCDGDRVTVRNVVSGAVLARTRGCPVAWRMFVDGHAQLTQVRDGEIVADSTVLVSRAQLAAAARRHPNLVGLDPSLSLHVVVREFGWLDEHRVAAILDVSAPGIQRERMIVLLDNGRLIGINVAFGGLIQQLVLSADGTYAAAEPGMIIRIDGRSWDLPRNLGILHVFAFSANDRWLAVGTRASVYLVSVTDIVKNAPAPRIDRVPILATDLVWEPGGVTGGTKPAG
jgi:hypothetical protein